MSQLETTAIITEHLGYPPISLLDDIINSVNDLMYKCTNAMEKYLNKKISQQQQQQNESAVTQRLILPTNEIEIGMAQLESLLEHSVDKNFDKFELYVLRNILNIPDQLTANNLFRLEHQLDLLIVSDSQAEESKLQIRDKLFQLEYEMTRNTILLQYRDKLLSLSKDISSFKEQINKFVTSNAQGQLYQVLRPIDESMKLLTTQLKQLSTRNGQWDLKKLLQLLNDNKVDARAEYINVNTNKILYGGDTQDKYNINITDPNTDM